MKGILEFQELREHRIVVTRARWTLETPIEVMRWYQLHASYLGARFGGPSDLVAIHDALDLAPRIATLWGSYRARLHERLIRFWVGVNSNARVRLTVNTSGALHDVPTTEAATVEEAIDAIVAMREAKENERTISESRLRRLNTMPMPFVIAEPKKQR